MINNKQVGEFFLRKKKNKVWPQQLYAPPKYTYYTADMRVLMDVQSFTIPRAWILPLTIDSVAGV